MAIISRGIGWSQESNLLWYILKQLNQLTGVLFGLKEAATPKYKVYTALLTQSGGDETLSINSGDLIIGITYTIKDNAGISGWDFTNVGAPNNNIDTSFVATGTTPASWTDGTLSYNTGAPVVTVLENTIGNVWFTYNSVGNYGINSNGLFTYNKVFEIVTNNIDLCDYGQSTTITFVPQSTYSIYIRTSTVVEHSDDILINTPIEIRVYN